MIRRRVSVEMDPVIIVAIVVGIIILLLFVGAPIKSFRLIGQGAVKLLIGALLLFFLNAFGSLIGYHMPINAVTTGVAGFLGIPGIALLIAVEQIIL